MQCQILIWLLAIFATYSYSSHLSHRHDFGRRYLGQTDVVCEMIAGVMLGAITIGIIAPEFQQWLFPEASHHHRCRTQDTQSIDVDSICYQPDWVGNLYVFDWSRVQH